MEIHVKGTKKVKISKCDRTACVCLKIIDYFDLIAFLNTFKTMRLQFYFKCQQSQPLYLSISHQCLLKILGENVCVLTMYWLVSFVTITQTTQYNNVYLAFPLY